ncbi:contactin-1 isoform X2 [Nematostella vectensis]|uniref:contactin-1 isoform X2 n=2 Tax=Nematostella vectensis TaxID=45351 RepID=UPI00207728A6|nr:contactin-1 isoform X2 [Nematostella vectensis]
MAFAWQCLLVRVSVLLLGHAQGRADNPDGTQLVVSRKSVVAGTNTTLRVNCSIFGRALRAENLSWTRLGQDVGVMSRQLSDVTLQLVIPDAKVRNSGKYRCTARTGVTLISKDVDITIADPPGRPRNIRFQSLNWKICFNWTAASSLLPVKYKCRYRCIFNCGLEDSDDVVDGWHETCQSSQHASGSRTLGCCLDHVTLFVRYEAVVVTENDAGTVESRPMEFEKDLNTTLGPPVALRGQASGYGEIVVSWQPNLYTEEAMSWDVQYVVTYHAQGKANRTLTVRSPGQHHVRLTDLAPYTRYTVYVEARAPISRSHGIAAGPLIVYTREESPSDAPVISEWWSAVNPEDLQKRNVTIRWKMPAQHKWNGRIKSFLIEYRKKAGRVPLHAWNEVMRVNATWRRSAVLVELACQERYEVEMKMCNSAGCSGISNRITLEALTNLPAPVQDSQEQAPRWTWIAIIGTGTLILAFTCMLLLAVCLKRSIQVGSCPDHVTSSSQRVTSWYPLQATTYHRKSEPV